MTSVSEFELQASVVDQSAYVFAQVETADDGGTKVHLRGSGFEGSPQGMLQMAEFLTDLGTALRREVLGVTTPQERAFGQSAGPKPTPPRGFNPKPVGPEEKK